MEYIEIDKKIFVQLFRYEDIEEFSKPCERFREDNYLAIKKNMELRNRSGAYI